MEHLQRLLASETTRVRCQSRYLRAITRLRLAMLFACALLLGSCSKAQPVVLQPLGMLEVPYPIQSLAWHPNGKWLAVGYFMRDEVEVWDLESRMSLFKVPSRRRPVNQSGQEILFSKDGNLLVTQDFLDSKSGTPPFPRSYADPDEEFAQKDKTRYVIARIWDMGTKREFGQIRGPASSLFGAAPSGMCWHPSNSEQLIVLRNTALAVYDLHSGQLLREIYLRFPFFDKPDLRKV